MVDALTEAWNALAKTQEVAQRAIEGVLANDELHLLTPLAKAELLHIIAPHSQENSAALAALKILNTINSHRELVEVLKRMGTEGWKGSVQTLMTNYYLLVRRGLFRSPHAQKAEAWLQTVLAA